MGNAAVESRTEDWVNWEVPGKPVSVRLTLEAAGRLAMAVREGFKALPRRGLETGGLLIGTRRQSDSQIIVEISDFEAIESEHAAGPSYLLSDSDRRVLESRIAAHEKGGRGRSVVGFYRSHTRRGFAITMEDGSLFSAYFRKPSDVFLLIKSNDEGPPTAGFIIREQGRILSETPYAGFPLNLTSFLPASSETSAPPPLRAPVAEPEEFREATERESPGEMPVYPQPDIAPWAARGRELLERWPVRLGIAGAIAVAMLLVFGVRTPRPASPPARPAVPLSLAIANSGNGLRVSWNHLATQRASGALLRIRDGEQEHVLTLDATQLSEGSVMYWPRNTDVNFRLEVLLDGSPVAESVRAFGGPASAAAIPAATESIERAAAPASEAPLAKAARPAGVPAPKPQERAQIETRSKQSRAFALQPEPVKAASPPPVLPEAPVVRAPVTGSMDRSNDLGRLLPPASSPASRNGTGSVRVRVEPVAGKRLEGFGRSLLFGKRHRRPDYTPPLALPNQPLPELPNRKPSRSLNIDVRVYVDPSGKVEYSELVSKMPEGASDLATAAVFASRRWSFVPARTSEGAAPGQVILHYEFLP